MKKLTRLTSLLMTIALFGLIGAAQAAPTAGISVTVTLQEVISVSVDPTSWAIGTVSNDSVTESGTYTVENDGNVTEDIAIDCGDSTDWTVVATITTTDQFKMEAKGGDLAAYTSIDTSKVLKSGLAASGTVTDLQLQFTAPQAGSATAAQTIPITITATKTP